MLFFPYICIFYILLIHHLLRPFLLVCYKTHCFDGIELLCRMSAIIEFSLSFSVC